MIGEALHGVRTLERLDARHTHGRQHRRCELQRAERLTLPMPGRTESLNAAVAGAIGMWELFA